MMGTGYIRLNRMLKNQGTPPKQTVGDVRLFRRIAWGAFVYVLIFAIAHLVVARYELALADDATYVVIIPVAIVLLFCWWLTDAAPRLARWSIAAISAFFAVVFLALLFEVQSVARFFIPPRGIDGWDPEYIVNVGLWNKMECGLYIIYFLVISWEATRQIISIRNGVDDPVYSLQNAE